MMSPTSQLMWACSNPLVGFDPERGQPVRAAADQGQNDRHAGTQLRHHHAVAQDRQRALQQEGPLFYVVSRYARYRTRQAGRHGVGTPTPTSFAVMLQKGTGATQVFGENLTAATPVWPSTMQD